MPQPTILGGFRIGEETGESEIDEGAFSYAMFIPFYSPFALSISHFLNFKLPIERSPQSQPLQDILL